jgi:hypothetical protein
VFGSQTRVAAGVLSADPGNPGSVAVAVLANHGAHPISLCAVIAALPSATANPIRMQSEVCLRRALFALLCAMQPRVDAKRVWSAGDRE